MELGEEAAAFDTSASGRDLIAEAVESGVELGVPELDITEPAVPPLELPLESLQAEEEASAVNLGPEKTAELPIASPSSTGVNADAEEMDLEALLDSINESGASGNRGEEDIEAGNLPLEEVEMEPDAIDLAGLPDRVSDSAPPSGIHSEEEVDLEALLAQQESSKASGGRALERFESEPDIDLDAEAVDLGATGSSKALADADAEAEEIDLESTEEVGSASGLLLEMESEEEEVSDEDQAEEVAEDDIDFSEIEDEISPEESEEEEVAEDDIDFSKIADEELRGRGGCRGRDRLLGGRRRDLSRGVRGRRGRGRGGHRGRGVRG